MTIAACYVSPEGIVFGADSTTTVNVPGSPHYFNHAQKLFEIGEDSTLGIVTWGLGGLNVSSHRYLIARFGDDLVINPPRTVEDAALRWSAFFWNEYSSAAFIVQTIADIRQLAQKIPHDPTSPPNPTMRTIDEENIFENNLRTLTVGFCLGGHVLPSRQATAYEILFSPLAVVPPAPRQLPMHNPCFWGAPNMINRLLRGCDWGLRTSILSSGHWTGTENDLDTLIDDHTLGHAILPIRDAIDFTHACINSTIKALKFSNLSQICGGPIEIAVITSDRKFRWVRHKAWDAAIPDGGAQNV